jgi:hypothetical protein
MRMRQRNWRLIIVGLVLIVAAAGFFLFMMGMAPKSNDPKTMLETVGQVSGAVAGIAVVMILFGLIGRRTSPS